MTTQRRKLIVISTFLLASLFVLSACSLFLSEPKQKEKVFEQVIEHLLDNQAGQSQHANQEIETQILLLQEEPTIASEATIMINGDNLIHNIIYMSAIDSETGIYDFKPIYEEVKPLIEGADIAIANFEGTMSPDYPLGGYPLFNCPPEMAADLADVGYDLVDLANNHITDSRAEGIRSTRDYLAEAGVESFGINFPDDDFIRIMEANGIRFSFLGYSYGFNGMDATLSAEDQKLLSWIDPEKMQADIQIAKEISDVVFVFPHLGIEYQLEPNNEQIELYHQLVDWGADFVIGNHPHVIQPIEIYKDKFILYSLGNFISNQRIETGLDIWTERGMILEINFSKDTNHKVEATGYKVHPTWVSREVNGGYSPEGYELYDYKVLLAENHLDNPRVKTAYEEVLEHVEGY